METTSRQPRPAEPFTVRRLESADAALARQLAALFDEGITWDERQGRLFFADPANLLLVAFCDGEPRGFATAHRLQRFDHHRASVLLYEIGVDERFQRRGIGTALVAGVLEWARESGAFEMWVLTEPANTAARALYRATGGEEDEAGVTMFVYPIAPGVS
jgi:GNAT superfamily N-acetyltransferase